MKQNSRCRIAGEAMNPNERTSTNPAGVMGTLPPDTMDTSGQCAAERCVCPHVSKCNANNGCIAAGVRGREFPYMDPQAVRERAAGVEVRKIGIPGTRPLIEIARELLADPEFAQIMRDLKDRPIDGVASSDGASNG